MVNKDELEGYFALARKQDCQVKSGRGKNLSDKVILLSSCSAEELTEAQKQDGNLEHLREYLVSEAVPSAEELYGCNPEVKCYHLERVFFRLDDLGVIWRQTGDPGDSERVLTPRTLQDEVMRLCHDVPSAGHQSEFLLVAHVL